MLEKLIIYWWLLVTKDMAPVHKHVSILLIIFQTGSHAKLDSNSKLLLTQPPECWDYNICHNAWFNKHLNGLY